MGNGLGFKKNSDNFLCSIHISDQCHLSGKPISFPVCGMQDNFGFETMNLWQAKQKTELPTSHLRYTGWH